VFFFPAYTFSTDETNWNDILPELQQKIISFFDSNTSDEKSLLNQHHTSALLCKKTKEQLYEYLFFNIKTEVEIFFDNNPRQSYMLIKHPDFSKKINNYYGFKIKQKLFLKKEETLCLTSQAIQFAKILKNKKVEVKSLELILPVIEETKDTEEEQLSVARKVGNTIFQTYQLEKKIQIKLRYKSKNIPYFNQILSKNHNLHAYFNEEKEFKEKHETNSFFIKRCGDNGGNIFLHALFHTTEKKVFALIQENQIKIDEKSFDGYNALHLAIFAENLAAIHFLITQTHSPIDINEKTDIGFTALHIVSFYVSNLKKNEEMFHLIMKDPKIQINIKDNQGATPLHRAIKENVKIAMALIAHPEIKINEKNKNGFSALHLAIENKKEAIVTALVEHPQIQINIKDKEGNTPLHLAASEGNFEIVKTLLKNADINEVNNKGETPLQIAQKNHFSSIIKLLSEIKAQ
jgi:ankyrin repeat protein